MKSTKVQTLGATLSSYMHVYKGMHNYNYWTPIHVLQLNNAAGMYINVMEKYYTEKNL